MPVMAAQARNCKKSPLSLVRRRGMKARSRSPAHSDDPGLWINGAASEYDCSQWASCGLEAILFVRIHLQGALMEQIKNRRNQPYWMLVTRVRAERV
jgi:hypothetical protein